MAGVSFSHRCQVKMTFKLSVNHDFFCFFLSFFYRGMMYRKVCSMITCVESLARLDEFLCVCVWLSNIRYARKNSVNYRLTALK